MYLFTLFHIVNQYHRRVQFFLSKYQHDYKYTFLQQFNKQEVNL